MPKGVYIHKKGKFSSNWRGGRAKDYQKTYLQKLRKSTIEALGGKCVRCGFTDRRALQIDHINGGGSKERKEKGFNMEFHKHVLQSFLKKENKYQILCANCNWIKRFEQKEVGKISPLP